AHGGAVPMAAEIKEQDGEVLFLEFLGQVIPTLFSAGAAQGVQHQRTRRLVPRVAGEVRSVDLHLVVGIELDPFGFGGPARLRPAAQSQTSEESKRQACAGQPSHVPFLQGKCWAPTSYLILKHLRRSINGALRAVTVRERCVLPTP